MRVCEPLEARVALSAAPLVATAFVTNAVSDFEYQPWNGGIAIQSYVGAAGTVVIPPTIDGWPVTVLFQNAFYGRNDVTGVVLPTGLTTIYENAFAGTGITTILVPETVTFAFKAFQGAAALEAIEVDPRSATFQSVDGVLFGKGGQTLEAYPAGRAGAYAIPAGVTSIRDSAFAFCTRLTSVTLPSSLRFIGESAFASCAALSQVVIQDGVEVIPQFAFRSCHALVRVTVPSSVQSMSYAFFDCPKLSRIDGSATAPVALAATRMSRGRVRLTWQPPPFAAWAAGNPSLSLRQYRIEFSGNAGRTWRDARPVGPTATATVVGGLTGGRDYIFRVTPRAGFDYAAPYVTTAVVSGQSASIAFRVRR